LTQLPITDDLMITFLQLCDPRRDSLAASASEQEWHYISHLSKLHGVTPFLYYRTRSLGLKLPEQIEKEWLGIYLYQIAEEKKARRQIKELKEILDPNGIPFILLKGASAMLRLYPQPGLRTFVDLDILIPADMISQFKQTMAMAGYKPIAPMYSPEYEDLQKFDNHLAPFMKEEGLMIEPHVNILGEKGNYLIALPEIWRDKEETNADGIITGHLNREHFIIHMLVHCAKDLSNIGFIEIKGLIDVLYAVRTWSIDWSKVHAIAKKWGVDKNVLPIMATLNNYWKTGISLPGIPEPLALHILQLGVKDQKNRQYAKTPSRYIKRLFQTREFPDISSRIRYLVRLFFPNSENLRWSYNVPPGKSTIPYYFCHFFIQSKKFFMGLWHQILFHPK